MLGFKGVDTVELGFPLSWAARPERVNMLRDKKNYDWDNNRKAWYFQATAAATTATVFVEKSPPFLLVTDQLSKQFSGAKFILLLRNPYAVVEGILRRTIKTDLDALETAASHVVSCFCYQRYNLEQHQRSVAFLTYERICSEPEESAQQVQNLVPELADLDFRQRIPVKGMYDEMLRNMNEDHIARLSSSDIRAITSIFRPHRATFEEFGYELM